MARARADASGDVELRTRLDGAEQELAQSLAELRELARGIHPAILHAGNGVGAALRSLAERSAAPVELRSVPEGRYAAEVEATTYLIVSEALANVAKHADASCAWVSVAEGGGSLTVEVRDDGIGGAAMNGGTGLRGLADRVEAVGGRIDVQEAGRARVQPSVRRSRARRGSRRCGALPRGARPVARRRGVQDPVGQAANADELLTIIREASPDRLPDVTIVDIRMPPSHTTEGLVAAKTIRAEHSGDRRARLVPVHRDRPCDGSARRRFRRHRLPVEGSRVRPGWVP